jgi:hypothetical protein
MALLDRRLDSPAAFAIWLVSHTGRSLLPRPTASLLGAQAPIGYFFMSLVAADRGRLSKELEEDADCPDQAFRRI